MAIDGIDWVKKSKANTYDVVIVDSTDPSDADNDNLSAATLFTKEFYQNCNRVLTKDGILTCQGESPYYDFNIYNMKRSYGFLKQTFPKNFLCQYFLPTYSSGWWMTGFATKGKEPLKADFKKWEALKIKTRFYNKDVHFASFSYMSNYVKGLLNIK
jgi:spermidine synthase